MYLHNVLYFMLASVSVITMQMLWLHRIMPLMDDILSVFPQFQNKI
jgi:hypothetical protein